MTFENSKTAFSYQGIHAILQARSASDTTSNKVAYLMLDDQLDVTEEISYRGLYNNSIKIGHYLSEKYGTDKTVLLVFPNGLEFIKAIFGCFYAGNIAVPIEPPRPHHSLEKFRLLIEDVRPSVILSTTKLKVQLSGIIQKSEEIPFLPDIVCVEDILADHASPEDWQGQNNEIAFLQYTSGSTGIPKGTIIKHSNLIHNLAQIRECSKDDEHSIGLSWLPFYHDMGLIGGMFFPLFLGIPLYLLLPASFVKRPFIWLKAIHKFSITVTVGPNFAYELCTQKISQEQCSDLKLDSLRVVFIGAETIRSATLKKFTEKFSPCGFRETAFLPCYGMAEVTLLATGTKHSELPHIAFFDKGMLEKNQVKQVEQETSDGVPIVSCGGSPSKITVRIVNPDTLKICSEKEVGEIWVSGPNVSPGYWNRSNDVSETFGNKLPGLDEVFLRTGDLGFLHHNELFVTGRLKELIIINGRNIFPHDIERIVEQTNPAIRLMGAAAFAIESAREHLIVLAEINRQYVPADYAVIVKEIRAAILQEFEIDSSVIELVRDYSLPKTSSGKLRRKVCRKSFEEGNVNSLFRWENPEAWQASNKPRVNDNKGQPVNETKNSKAIREWLVNKISELKEIEKSGIDPALPFANYGLDSLTLLQVLADLENWLGRAIPVSAPYEYNCITLLADHLAGESVSATDDFVPARKEINEEIAIVGMSCRFPGADNLHAFWDLLQHGKNAITEIPPERWDNQPYYDPSLRSWNKTNSKWGGFLNKIDRFDPMFFNITPVEAKSMDPQQRLLLELTWEAMEDMGMDITNWMGKPVGVFIGISNNEYAKINGPLHENDLFWSTSNSLSIAANRISYQFDFRGPSISIDTACSSSLSAVKLAFNSLQTGECEMAVAGGVNMILGPELNVNFSQAGALSPTGLCHTFDKEADGIVRSEGGGIIILKTLSRARADGDRIYGTICGGALNHDGRTNGLTAPNPLMQEIVIRSALSNAKLSADKVQYIETHGTGTPLGDPIEVKALQKVYDEPASRKKYSIGSVKSNLGHLEAAAGIASVIKLALSLYKKQIPPTIHFKSLNPHISLSGSQLSIQQELSSWSDQYDQVVAGVSAFGFGGTNVHLIFKSPDVIEKNEEAGSDILSEFPYLFLLSARDPDALKELAKGYYDLLSVDIEKKEEFLRKLCYNLALKRSHHPYRLAISFADVSECSTLLSLALQEKRHNLIAYGGNDTRNKDLVFVYSGHGGQWIGMGYRLLMLPAFRASIQETDAILKEIAGWSILDLLTSYNATDASRYERVDIVQPLIFAIQVAYTNLLAQLNIVPSIVIGHSMGEVAAAFIAGNISLGDAVKIIVFRSRLLQEGLHSQEEESGMAIVKIAADKLEKYITGNEEHLSIAVHNGPNMVVVGGNKRKLLDLLEKLKVDKIACQVLRTPGAGHSPQMEPIRQKLTEQLKTLEPLAGNIPMYSTTRGCIVTGTDMNAKYWGDNVRMTVQFYSGIRYLLEKDYRIFLEISPDALLASSIRENGRSLNKEAEVISVSKRDEDEIQNFYRATGLIYVKGWDINKENLFFKKESHVDLLPYPWRRKRFWKEKIQNQNYQPAATAAIDSKDYPDPEGMLQLDWILSELNEKDSVKNKSPLVVFTDNAASEEALAGCLQDYQEPVYFVQDGDCFEINDRCIKIRFAERSDHEILTQALAEKTKGARVNVLFLCTLNTEYPPATLEYTDAGISKTFLSLNILITTLMRNRAIIDSNVFVVTRGGQTVGKSSAITNPMHTALWGFVRSLIQEFANLPIMLMDLDPKNNLPGDALEILAEMNAGINEDQVAYRDGQRWVARLKKFPDALPSASYSFRIDRTYLITGGMGGIGLALAEWMVQKGARRIILLSRTQLPLRNTWSRITEESPFYQRIQQIKKLESMGATLFTLSVDISNRPRLFEALDSFQAEAWPPIGGVFHLAGILSWQPGPELTEEEFMKVFLPKAFGSWHLHSYFKKLPLDFFVLFSSGSAIFNSPYLASYSAANAFLDGLASHRNEQGLAATSINWGFWAETGMASQKLEEYNKNYIPTGLKQIRNNEAFNLLEGILSTQDRSQYIYIPFDWAAWIKRHPVFAKRPYMTDLTGNVENEVQRIASKLSRQKILDHPVNERRHQLESFMIKELASLLKIEEKELDISLKINEIGIDSLMAMELKNQLETDLQIYLPVAKLLEGPTISEFAAYVLEQMAETAGPTENGKDLNMQGSPIKSESKLILVNDRLVESDQLIKDLDGMDETELDTLLKQLSERNDLK